MALKEDSPPAAELHFEGDSLEVLSGFPDEIKRSLGFSLRQLQIGREPTSQTRNISSIGLGVYELKKLTNAHGTGRFTFRRLKTGSTCCTVLRRKVAKRIGEISRL